MILDETKPQLFYHGEDLFKKIEKALSCSEDVSLDIYLWSGRTIEYSIWACNGQISYFPLHNKTFSELLSWLKQKEMLLQKIELP